MFELVALSVFPAALLIAAANDLYEFKIPNWISVALFGSFFIAALLLRAPVSFALEGVMIGVGALALGFCLFAFKIVGGGDAKLLAAVAPWIGTAGLMSFLVNMAFSGGALAVALLAFRKTPALPIYAQAPWIMRLHSRPKDIPYAVAIAAGALISFPQTRLFQLAFGG